MSLPSHKFKLHIFARAVWSHVFSLACRLEIRAKSPEPTHNLFISPLRSLVVAAFQLSVLLDYEYYVYVRIFSQVDIKLNERSWKGSFSQYIDRANIVESLSRETFVNCQTSDKLQCIDWSSSNSLRKLHIYRSRKKLWKFSSLGVFYFIFFDSPVFSCQTTCWASREREPSYKVE